MLAPTPNANPRSSGVQVAVGPTVRQRGVCGSIGAVNGAIGARMNGAVRAVSVWG
jgi:hypothetical protein